MRSIAILEPAESWRNWLHAAAARTPGVSVLPYDSGQALLTALQWVRPAVIITSFRLPHVDGFSWLRSLRRNLHGNAAKLLVTVPATDVYAPSLARLAGADQVFRKVVDSDALRDELHTLSCAWRTDARLVPTRPLPQMRLPLFDIQAAAEPIQGDALKCRIATFGFLNELVHHVLGLPALYEMPTHHAAAVLVRFSTSCRTVGALRAAQYTEAMHASLVEGGLPRALLGECIAVMGETRRDMVAWLMEWPHGAC